jgi:hypothetical protein
MQGISCGLTLNSVNNVTENVTKYSNIIKELEIKDI